MNIGIFTDTYFPQINGVATSTMTLFEELRKNGHNVYIFTPSDKGVDKSEKYVYSLPSTKFIFSKNHRMTLMYPPKLILTFKKLKLDIVHTQTEFSMGLLGRLVADFYDIPIVHTYHTMYEDYVHYILNGHLISKKGAHKFSRIFCNKCDYIISPAEKTKFALEYYGVRKPISVIPTGLYLDKFMNKVATEELNTLKDSLGIKYDKKVCLILGRIAKEKSVDVIVHAFAKIINKEPDAVLLVVGGGPYFEELKKLCAKLKIDDRVYFTGFVKNKDIHKYYQLGDIFLTASTSETQGLTYIEAMASKLPMIVKKDDCIKNVISNDYNGYVFTKDSDLPELMLKLLNSPSTQKRFINNSLEVLTKYDANIFANDVLAVYEETLDNFNQNKVKQFIKNTRGKVNWKK